MWFLEYSKFEENRNQGNEYVKIKTKHIKWNYIHVIIISRESSLSTGDVSR